METALCAAVRLALAEGDVASIVSTLELPAGAHVLDLGCGLGAHAQAFAARGHAVTGVDRTGRLLNRAEAGSNDRGLHVEWVQADMWEYRRPAGFDLICSLYTSLGYFEDPGNRRVLENVLASLAHTRRVRARPERARDRRSALEGTDLGRDRGRALPGAALDIRRRVGSSRRLHRCFAWVRRDFHVRQRL